MMKWIILLFFYVQMASAFLVFNDDSYFVYRTPKFSYILTESDLKYLPALLEHSYQSAQRYEKEFSWTLDESTSLVVTSNRNQIANAFATVIPNNLTVYYKGGIDFLEPSASASWVQTLSTHEIAHLYQLNVKNKFGRNLKSIFGNQIFVGIPLLPLPFFISPTALLPKFLIEGNAVLNESKVNQGGRLFSGDSLVLATELAFSGEADLKYIMNAHLRFPFGQEKYIVGGYFQAYLADRYDFSVVNQFFISHANNNINPFDLKYSFAATFFAEYEDLYTDFLMTFKESQKDYQPYKGSRIASSLQAVQFNQIDDSIYFLTNENGKKPKKLNQFNSYKKQLTSAFSDLKLGKVFKVDDKLLTATAYDNRNINIFYSLVDDKDDFEEPFNNKYVTDIKGEFISYFDMNQSFDTGWLYRNDTKIAETDSKGLLDSEGNIYYFKQIGDRRILFKNFNELISIETRFAFLADVLNENEIYFISNSQNGSSLYCFCFGVIKRMLPYDNIAAAYKTPDGFLASFQTQNGYDIAFVTADQPLTELPFSLKSHVSEKYFQKEIAAGLPILSEAEPYFSLKQLRFSKYSFNYLSAKSYKTLLNSLSWTDPLYYANVDLIFSLSDNLAYNSLNFEYLPYSTQLNFNLINETDLFNSDSQKTTTNSYQIQIRNLVYQKKFHSIALGAMFEGGKNAVFESQISTAYLSYRYLESYFLNYRPYLYFEISPSLENSNSSLSQSFQVNLAKQLFTDFYFSMNYAKIESEYYKLDFAKGQKSFFRKGFYTPVYFSSLYSAKLFQSSFEFIYEVPYSKYYYRFPISLRRLAPFLGFQRNQSEEYFNGRDFDEISFATIGIESEVLLTHTFPVQLRLFSTDIIIEEKSQKTFNVQIQSLF